MYSGAALVYLKRTPSVLAFCTSSSDASVSFIIWSLPGSLCTSVVVKSLSSLIIVMSASLLVAVIYESILLIRMVRWYRVLACCMASISFSLNSCNMSGDEALSKSLGVYTILYLFGPIEYMFFGINLIVADIFT